MDRLISSAIHMFANLTILLLVSNRNRAAVLKSPAWQELQKKNPALIANVLSAIVLEEELDDEFEEADGPSDAKRPKT